MSDDYYDPELEAEQAAAAEQLNELLVTRQQLQSQTQALQGDVGSFRREQQLAWDAAHTASVELAAAQGGDFYAPDVGQQVAPDGTVTYDFDAHLHARGVDIDVGLTSTSVGCAPTAASSRSSSPTKTRSSSRETSSRPPTTAPACHRSAACTSARPTSSPRARSSRTPPRRRRRRPGRSSTTPAPATLRRCSARRSNG
jgi:hypothetical protein